MPSNTCFPQINQLRTNSTLSSNPNFRTETFGAKLIAETYNGKQEMEEMAQKYAEFEFEKLGEVRGLIPPKKRSVKRMMRDCAWLSYCFLLFISFSNVLDSGKEEESGGSITNQEDLFPTNL